MRSTTDSVVATKTSTPSLTLTSGDYTIDTSATLGRGSYSVVFRGKYAEKIVAVKVARSNFEYGITLEGSIKSLQKEHGIFCEIIKKLQTHSTDHAAAASLIQYYGCHTNLSQCGLPTVSLVMEFANAGSLADWIYLGRTRRTQIPFSWAAAYPIMKDMVMGLYLLHELQFTYCDMKADNVLLSEQHDRLWGKICDFGLTKQNDSSFKPCGSPIYCAPELWAGIPNSAKSDMYSWACILFEMATHRVIYSGLGLNTMDKLIMYVVSQGKRENISDATPKKIAHLIT